MKKESVMKKLTIGLVLAGAAAALALPLSAQTQSVDKPTQTGPAGHAAHDCAGDSNNNEPGHKHDGGKDHARHASGSEGTAHGHGQHH